MGRAPLREASVVCMSAQTWSHHTPSQYRTLQHYSVPYTVSPYPISAPHTVALYPISVPNTAWQMRSGYHHTPSQYRMSYSTRAGRQPGSYLTGTSVA
eukprot:2519400-Rhodomonas_salina.1